MYVIHLKYIKKVCRKNYKNENCVKNLKNYKIPTAYSAFYPFFSEL